MSQIERHTGLEPVAVQCRWYPSKECDVINRPGNILVVIEATL